MFYNDQPADMILYQGLAYRMLGEEETAKERFHQLISYGKTHLDDQIRIDFFAVSLPDFLIFDEDLDKKNRIHCLYLIGLGNYGLEKFTEATQALDEAWKLDPSNCSVVLHRNDKNNLIIERS
jgi:tetratricopeptide (TPR) repeat protein